MDLQALAMYIFNTKTFEEASRIFTEVVIAILFYYTIRYKFLIVFEEAYVRCI